jgi:hypothetical protein
MGQMTVLTTAADSATCAARCTSYVVTMLFASCAHALILLQASLCTADTTAPPSVTLAASLQHLRAQKRAMQRLRACHPSPVRCSTFATRATTSSRATRYMVRDAPGSGQKGALRGASVATISFPTVRLVIDVLQVAHLLCSATSSQPRWASRRHS